MIWVLTGVCVIAGLYQVAAFAACLRHKLYRAPSSETLPPVSILKPVRGVTPDVLRAIQTHLDQNYPDFELLLGVREDEVGALHITDPRARVVVCRSIRPNRKVGSLVDLQREARHQLLIVNDADIAVPRSYIQDIVAELARRNVGLVSCVYRARSATPPGRFEALGVATDFAPSALVAPFAGVSEFGLGSTLAFHRSDLEKIGGFEALSNYLADDYQLGCKLHSLGRRNVMAKPVVETILSPASWLAAWQHQVRWARTVRLSRPGGYAGLPVTFATLWALAEAAAGLPWVAVTLIAARMIMAVTAGYVVLGSADVLRLFWLIPIRDLYAVAVWTAALFGNHVEWGGETLKLDSEGRIV